MFSSPRTLFTMHQPVWLCSHRNDFMNLFLLRKSTCASTLLDSCRGYKTFHKACTDESQTVCNNKYKSIQLCWYFSTFSARHADECALYRYHILLFSHSRIHQFAFFVWIFLFAFPPNKNAGPNEFYMIKCFLWSNSQENRYSTCQVQTLIKIFVAIYISPSFSLTMQSALPPPVCVCVCLARSCVQKWKNKNTMQQHT